MNGARGGLARQGPQCAGEGRRDGRAPDPSPAAAGGCRSRNGGAHGRPADPARARERAALGQAHRHRARRDPDPGEPLVRPLLRHPAGRARLWRSSRARHLLPAGIPGARLRRGAASVSSGNRRPAAVLSGYHAQVARPARKLGWRRDGRIRTRTPRIRRARSRARHDGLLRARRTSRSTSRSPKRSRSATTTTARCSGRPIPTACTACRPRSTPKARAGARWWKRSGRRSARASKGASRGPRCPSSCRRRA